MKNKEKVKTKKKKSKRIALFILILIVAVALVLMALNIKNNSGGSEIKEKKNVVDSISKYGYTINDSDTKLFKKKFYELKKVLDAKEVNNEEYSKLVAQLFIIDFFTLDNKLTKNDIGGVQFVYENYKTTFIDKARDEFYKYVKNNLDGSRNQSLPIVSNVTVTSIDTVNAGSVLNKDEFKSITDAYEVKIDIQYKEDLGYQKSATVTVVKDGDAKFSVAKLEE